MPAKTRLWRSPRCAIIAFYAGPLDHCSVAGETATPQPGDFHGGWITSREAGPFKEVPDSRG